VAQAVELAVHGAGRPGVYNLAGAGSLDGPQVLKTLGLRTLPVPSAVVGASLDTLLAVVPPVIPGLAWPDLVSAPILLDTERARETLGWRPNHSSEQALRSTRDALEW